MFLHALTARELRWAGFALCAVAVTAFSGCGGVGGGPSPASAALERFESELADLDAELAGPELPSGSSDRLNRAAEQFAQVASGTRAESDANAVLEDLKKIEALLEKRAAREEIQQAVKNLQGKAADLKNKL